MFESYFSKSLNHAKPSSSHSSSSLQGNGSQISWGSSSLVIRDSVKCIGGSQNPKNVWVKPGVTGCDWGVTGWPGSKFVFFNPRHGPPSYGLVWSAFYILLPLENLRLTKIIRDHLRWYSFTAGHVKFIVLGARKIMNAQSSRIFLWVENYVHYTSLYYTVFTMFQMSRTNMTNRLIFCCSEAT